MSMAKKAPNKKSQEPVKQNPAGERKRDEERDDGGPAYGGEAWEVADERGDQRFGHARNDDADPSTLEKRDPDLEDADPEIESGGERAGMGRGEKPRKPDAG
jgi:hypothetical protein